VLVSHAGRFIYTKTLKTAGTSIEAAFQPHCMPPSPEPVPEYTRCLESEYGIGGARGWDVQGEAWINHMSADEIRRRLGRPIWDAYLRFTAIRNPFDKVVSWFHWTHSEIKDQPRAVVFREFNRWVEDPVTVLPMDRDKYVIDDEYVMSDEVRYAIF
jgi:hypothetical protein